MKTEPLSTPPSFKPEHKIEPQSEPEPENEVLLEIPHLSSQDLIKNFKEMVAHFERLAFSN